MVNDIYGKLNSTHEVLFYRKKKENDNDYIVEYIITSFFASKLFFDV
jgi:hypothetical protein